MESLFGRENMARTAAVDRMIPAYEREIQEIARVANLVRRSTPKSSAWYCPLLVRMGEVMVTLGTHLKTRYKIDNVLQVR
jgi:hypothetical protein